MAKLGFSKLGLKKVEEIKTVEYNGQKIEIKQYLPVEDKLGLATDILNNCVDENNFMNVFKFEMFMDVFTLRYYTNITFTDKQIEDYVKLYDLLKENKIFDLVKDNINPDDYEEVYNNAWQLCEEYYKYRNSVFGIIESINNNYDNLKFDTESLAENISNPQNLTLLKDILTKMG